MHCVYERWHILLRTRSTAGYVLVVIRQSIEPNKRMAFLCGLFTAEKIKRILVGFPITIFLDWYLLIDNWRQNRRWMTDWASLLWFVPGYVIQQILWSTSFKMIQNFMKSFLMECINLETCHFLSLLFKNVLILIVSCIFNSWKVYIKIYMFFLTSNWYVTLEDQKCTCPHAPMKRSILTPGREYKNCNKLQLQNVFSSNK